MMLLQSYFHFLKRECIPRKTCTNRDEASSFIFKYIATSKPKRKHTINEMKSPMDFEKQQKPKSQCAEEFRNFSKRNPLDV